MSCRGGIFRVLHSFPQRFWSGNCSDTALLSGGWKVITVNPEDMAKEIRHQIWRVSSFPHKIKQGNFTQLLCNPSDVVFIGNSSTGVSLMLGFCPYTLPLVQFFFHSYYFYHRQYHNSNTRFRCIDWTINNKLQFESLRSFILHILCLISLFIITKFAPS